jgi:phosphohistidine phosphatase
MKYLTVIRHAKSSWAQPGLADHDRPLNARGLRAAPAIAQFLHHTYLGGNQAEPLLPPIDRILCSTAQRTLSTAQIMRETFGMDIEQLILDQRLYLAPEQRILQIIRDCDESWQHIMIVGHNPGLHDFLNRIMARAKINRLPTCTANILALPTDFWALTDWNEAQLLGHITPRLLERRFPSTYPNISDPNQPESPPEF